MNVNTIVDALRSAGIPADQYAVLTNPGGAQPTLFTVPPSYASNGGAPIVLEVPTVVGNAAPVGSLSGVGLNKGAWYADGGGGFVVRATGRIQPNNFGKVFQLNLYAGNGEQSGTGALQDFQIGSASVTLPLVGSGNAFTNFQVKAECTWDSQSLALSGTFSGFIGGTAITSQTFSIYNPSAWIAQQAAGAYNPLPFVLGVKLPSSAAAGNDLVYLTDFSADMN